ncbi:hypothetical protein HZB04_01940 [Candidatus Wolfebacteria bacterium]|nr:hypothetical protein [Candidatus Wolfebacteria bacterium]
MTNKKIIFIFLISAALSAAMLSLSASAITSGQIAKPGAGSGLPDLPVGMGQNLKIDNIITIMADIFKVAYVVFFIISGFMIILAAFTYLTAKDEPEKISGVHKQLIWAAVAVVVALLSVGFNVIIENFIK